MGFFRPTFAEIDLGAIKHNFEAARSLLPPSAGIMAMVKADAYGHGAVSISKKLEECGVAAFGVATVEEGLELREAGIKTPIVVMGGLMGMGSPACGMMVGADLTPVVHSSTVLEFLEAVSKAAGKTIPIHLKIDTGMGRLGALPSSAKHLLETIKKCRHLKLEGVMTHFASAEDEEYTGHQLEVFSGVLAEIEKVAGKIHIVHVANSCALINKRWGEVRLGSQIWVRPGLMLYGGYPSDEYRKKVSLEPVMSLKSRVALVKRVPEGTNVSYGCTFTTKRKSRLAVIPMGYADGYPWSLSNKGLALVGGNRVPVVGRVTMDMIIVDVTDTDASAGDEVVLLGKQGAEEITVAEFASLAGTIPYEIMCGISKRMPRVYIENISPLP